MRLTYILTQDFLLHPLALSYLYRQRNNKFCRQNDRTAEKQNFQATESYL